MQIIIKTVTGRLIYLDVEPLDTIAQVKIKLQEEVGFTPDKQNLFFAEILLEDKKTLSDYKINDQSVINFIPKMMEGGFFDEIKDEEININEEKEEDKINLDLNIKQKEEENDSFSLLPIFYNEENKDNNEIKNENNNELNILNKEENNDLLSNNIPHNNQNNNEIIHEQKEIIIDKDIFDKNNLIRNELYLNLIYFDLKLERNENYKYLNRFNLDVIGYYHAINDLTIFQNYLEEIKDEKIPYIVISSGTSGKDVIPICLKYQFIKEVIIFCGTYEYNKHYLEEYPGYVKKVLTEIKQVYSYIKTLENNDFKNVIKDYLYKDKYILSYDKLNNEKQMQQCLIISSYEYDKYYVFLHKAYSYFFGDINNKNEKSMFKKENLNKIIDYLPELDFEDEDEISIMMNKFNNLACFDNNNQFIEKFIREYTNESNFCYLLNRQIKNYEKGFISFSYFMGPLLYGLNKYVKDNPSFAFSKKMELYKIIKCTKLDFLQYKLNLGHIICLPSLTSTTSKKVKYEPQKNEINNDKNIIIRLIFKYYYKKGSISPGIIIEDQKLKDKTYLSCRPKENEVLLFPFTFAKITEIKMKIENKVEIQNIYLEILNRTFYDEYILKTDFQKRTLYFKPVKGKK